MKRTTEVITLLFLLVAVALVLRFGTVAYFTPAVVEVNEPVVVVEPIIAPDTLMDTWTEGWLDGIEWACNIEWPSETQVDVPDEPVVILPVVREFPDIVESVMPAIVYIKASSSYGGWSGSGVCLSSDGLILTAAHVVSDAEEFMVRFPSGREFTSTNSFVHDKVKIDAGFIVLDMNDPNDANDVPYIEDWAISSNLRAGEGVFIVGSPFGDELFNTVTKGIVSSPSRDISFFGEKSIMQVDAQAWGGNSGGPVFDLEGRLVGILVGGMGGADGISFVTPSDVCAALLKIYTSHMYLVGLE